MARIVIGAIVLLIWAAAQPALAEVFVLSSGGQLEGELLNPDESPRKGYRVRTKAGIEVTLSTSQVVDVLRRRPEEDEYEKIRHEYPDTVEGHLALSDWCREHRLKDQRELHFRRILELDPDHARARAALGYQRFEGQWKTQAEIMTERGFVYYRGDWKLPQQIAIDEEREAREKAERDWRIQLKRWGDWINGRNADRREEALGHLVNIEDPYAVPGLIQNFWSARNNQMRLLYVQALAHVGTPAAISELGRISLEVNNREIRTTCLEYLEREPRPTLVDMYIKRLHDRDNRIVNRAAYALEKMNDPLAIAPLIDALITVHEVEKDDLPAGNFNPVFDQTGGNGGFTFGAPSSTTVPVRFRNSAVLDALVKLTGGISFQFEVANWKSWLSTQQQTIDLSPRRD